MYSLVLKTSILLFWKHFKYIYPTRVKESRTNQNKFSYCMCSCTLHAERQGVPSIEIKLEIPGTLSHGINWYQDTMI